VLNLKKAITVAAFLLTSVGAAKAQTILAGPALTLGYGNVAVGLTGKLEIPIKRAEIDLAETFSPYEKHIALGSGWANQFSVGGYGWFSNHFGITGRIEDSRYSTSIEKDSQYVMGGLAYRGPGTRAGFGYIQEINNGIGSTGIETNHLKAAEASFDERIACWTHGCLRAYVRMDFGHSLTQGNPQCDGEFTPGHVTCPRRGALGGGEIIGMYFEFHPNGSF
jgi:hypothetical protein